MKSILLAGLPNEIATKLESSLEGVRVQSVSRLDLVPLKLAEQDYSLLVLSETMEGAGLVSVFKHIVAGQAATRPPVICCLPQSLNSGAVGELIGRCGSDEFLFYPLDGDDLVQRVSRLLDVSVRPPSAEKSAQQHAAEAIASLWERFRPANESRMETIEGAILALLTGSATADGRGAAAQAAQRLAGCIESFGFGDAARLARDIEHILAAPGEWSPSQTQLLCLLVVVLRAEVDSASVAISKAAHAGSAAAAATGGA